jgi:glycosyltransferase involved in cell wall biosynthesis
MAEKLSSADLVHLQVSVWTDGSWGPGRQALSNLDTARRYCRAPLIVTLHDVNSLGFLDCARRLPWLSRALYELAKAILRPAVRLGRQIARGRLSLAGLVAELWTLEVRYPCLVARKSARISSAVLTFSRSESDVLRSMRVTRPTAAIPHFVEETARVPAPATDGAESRAKTLVVAGFLIRSKGHRIVLEAMRLVPEVKVVFVGGPSLETGAELYHSEIITVASELGVQDRLEVTGYVSDDEYYRRVTAADVAICPFGEDKSASGSLSSLIAVGCPILASDIPLIATYNAMVPGAILTFHPYTPEALADAIRSALSKPRLELAKPLDDLRERLSIARVYDQHVDQYRRTLARLSATGIART